MGPMDPMMGPMDPMMVGKKKRSDLCWSPSPLRRVVMAAGFHDGGWDCWERLVNRLLRWLASRRCFFCREKRLNQKKWMIYSRFWEAVFKFRSSYFLNVSNISRGCSYISMDSLQKNEFNVVRT